MTNVTRIPPPFEQCRAMASPLIACGRPALAAALTPGGSWTARECRRSPSEGSSCSAWPRNRCRSSRAWANVLKCAAAIESRQGREDMPRNRTEDDPRTRLRPGDWPSSLINPPNGQLNSTRRKNNPHMHSEWLVATSAITLFWEELMMCIYSTCIYYLFE